MWCQAGTVLQDVYVKEILNPLKLEKLQAVKSSGVEAGLAGAELEPREATDGASRGEDWWRRL